MPDVEKALAALREALTDDEGKPLEWTLPHLATVERTLRNLEEQLERYERLEQLRVWQSTSEAEAEFVRLRGIEEQYETLRDALRNIAGYGISPNSGYPVVSADVVKVAKRALA